MRNFALGILAFVAAFSCTIYFISARAAFESGDKIRGIWYSQLVLVTVVSAAILISRFFTFFPIPTVVSVFILAPIYGIPPLIKLIEWRRTGKWLS